MVAIPYARRIVDDDLDDLLAGLPAIAIEGPKAVGKTRTALERAKTVYRLDDPGQLVVAKADPQRILEGERPVLIDEWQRLPQSWDLVRRAVDDGVEAGAFLLTRSAVPDPLPTHSGAGRIVSLRMRPMALTERGYDPSVSLASLFGGEAQIRGETDVGLDEYTAEILSSGFPAIRALPATARERMVSSYLQRVVDRDISDDAGTLIRNPVALRRWMTAYAAAVSTPTSFEKIRNAATAGHEHKPARNTADSYRDALERVWVLDEVLAWTPGRGRLRELGRSPVHQLADPALAAELLGARRESLLAGEGAAGHGGRDAPLLGALFQALATLCIKIYAERSRASVGHLRTARGRHEVDLVAHRPDGTLVAIEVKLAATVEDADVRHLTWLKHELGNVVRDCLVVTTGTTAYRRQDGIGVVPLALLGP